MSHTYWICHMTMNIIPVAFIIYFFKLYIYVIGLTGIILRHCSDEDKYLAMSKILDGNDIVKLSHVRCDTDDFQELRDRLTKIDRRLRGLSEAASCDLCTVLQKSFVHHEGRGCPLIFNICFKCLGKHSSNSCTFPLFKVKNGFCWKCWLPTFEIFGVSFHSNRKELLGVNCLNEAKDFVKPLCMHFFYNRTIVNVPCPCSDISHYQTWLFSNSSHLSVCGSGQMPNILLILEAVLTVAHK